MHDATRLTADQSKPFGLGLTRSWTGPTKKLSTFSQRVRSRTARSPFAVPIVT